MLFGRCFVVVVCCSWCFCRTRTVAFHTTTGPTKNALWKHRHELRLPEASIIEQRRRLARNSVGRPMQEPIDYVADHQIGTKSVTCVSSWTLTLSSSVALWTKDTKLRSCYDTFQDWIVYVDQSKASLERGGVATLDAFMGLATSESVSVKAAIFPKPTKGKGPFIRCVPVGGQNNNDDMHVAFEVSNVNSVEKVYRVLTKHMGLEVREGHVLRDRTLYPQFLL